MAEKLLKEERLILNCLRIYECLRYEQLLTLINNKPEDTAKKIINGLKKRQYVFEDEAGYVKIEPKTEPDQKTISAFWILLQYIGKITQDAHYRANFPSEIFFLRNNVQYEIIVINQDEENLLKMLFLENRNTSTDEQDAVKYIIIVPGEESIENCLRYIPDSAIENNQIMFASIGEYDEDGIPSTQYFRV